MNKTTNPDGSARPPIPGDAVIADTAHISDGARVGDGASVGDEAVVGVRAVESALEAGGAGLEEAGLLPCPFCGGPASIETIGGGDATVMCKGDDCWCMIGAYRSEDEACDAWNVRAIESALPSAGAGLVLTDEEWARCRYWLEHFTSDEAGQPLRAAEQADIAAVLRAFLAGQEGGA